MNSPILRSICSQFRSRYYVIHYFSSRPRPSPSSYLFRPNKLEISEEIAEKLERGEAKYRRHPGVLHLPVQRVGEDVQKAIGRILVDNDVPISSYKEQVEKLDRHLQNRRLPFEAHDFIKLRQDIEKRIRQKDTTKGRGLESCDNEEERAKYEEKVQRKCEKRFRSSIYNWKEMKYDSPSRCIEYCILRFAPEYAVLRRVFNEIIKREPNFKPRHVFDFGSGVGTTFFASESAWTNSVEEYTCVDVSQEMNDFLALLLRGGTENGEPCHRNVTVRPYLPATIERTYDVVVSAYSLFELGSYEERIRTVANLWMKTGQFLILIERGTNAGFRAVVEARDYILAGAHEIYRSSLSAAAAEHNLDLVQVELILKRNDLTESEKFRLLRQQYPDVEFPTLLPHGHVFSPCPHDMGCPRLMDVTPCNFPARHFPLRLKGGEEVPQTELFSYVILRKGYAPDTRWPRIVREPRKSKSCIWCQTCTPHGVLEDNPYNKGPTTSERGKQYRLAKRIEWGDLLPVNSRYEEDE